MMRLLCLVLALASASAFVPAAVHGPVVASSRVASLEMKAKAKKQISKNKFYNARRVGGTAEGVRGYPRFPVSGTPDRAAAGQAGGPFLIAGLLPLLVELSRVSQLPGGGFGMGGGA